MTGGMARIAGTVFVLYATILIPVIPDAAGHIAVASLLGAPAAILISLIMVPDPERAHRRQVEEASRGPPRPWTPSSKAPAPASNFCSTSSPC